MRITPSENEGMVLMEFDSDDPDRVVADSHGYWINWVSPAHIYMEFGVDNRLLLMEIPEWLAPKEG